ncbi:Endo-1,4-beta-xylanase A precursor [Indibacter alkaliphilus LW1]|uniref:endo-1,4-beta-xylanase n=1 Tax=Indibacter alkaliphilus (strain CCUG 57479 / KCTC 22604 / LW1) TaxID=1189612 RepID=S2D1R6_INDAL|nr:endo-1,4-beta-xylanase [Indibacter alkaliphilus]EOZ92819.1 Endo-1,4-beta-xylanase A precursor [Indibacter alkaliphilus LW1]
MQNKILRLGILCMLGFSSCTDFNALEYEVEKPISVERQEEINSYDDLIAYVEENRGPDFRLGVSLPATDYTAQGIRYRLINRNFNEFVPSSGLDHRSIVQNNGSLNLTQAIGLFESIEEKGISLYGSPLVWHRNQNAAYLNGLLSPLIVNSPAFMNELEIASLAEHTMEGWTFSGDVQVEEGEGMGSNTPAVKMVAGSGVNAPEDLQLTSPMISVLPGKTYEIIAYIKSDQEGEGRFTFEGLGDSSPEIDYNGDGIATESFTTSISWKEVKFSVSNFEEETFQFKLELGYHPGVTYFLDINNLYVYDTDGDPLINNLISNGDFESGIAWGGWGNNSERGVTEDGMGAGNTGRAFYVTNPSLTGGFWEVQTIYELGEPLNEGETYQLSFWVKGDAEGAIRPELQSPDFSSNGFGQVFVTTDWRLVTLTTTVTAADRNRFIISYGEFAGTVYIDEVVLASESLTGGSTTVVEKTEIEKSSIIENQLDRWINEFVTETKELMTVREVISEPLSDANPSQLRGAQDTPPAEGEFYWQDYLGKDYAVKAFQKAREYGNPGDMLLINESGMDQNLAKCQALLDYVEYIEENGGQIDGIGTKMTLDLESDLETVQEMFRMLASTGKKIKITGLEIRLNDGHQDSEYLQEQYELYKEVVKQYFNNIPADQQLGITISNPIDSGNGGRSGLWDSALTRKPAYAGFAEGIID